jgi:hypothetical protein
MDLKTLLITSVASMVATLLTGKFLRKAVVLVVSPFVRKTKTKVDDELLETAKKDLGVEGDETDGK